MKKNQLNLFDNLQCSKFLGYSNFHKEPIISFEIKKLVEERKLLKIT